MYGYTVQNYQTLLRQSVRARKDTIMPPEVFTLSEAQALQCHLLRATQDYQDAHGRTLIPHTGICRVIGLDVWDEYFATIAV
jgi:hypothetical protein